MSANFTPTLKPYNKLNNFWAWCQKVLPLVYDDSLSYYELLCKMLKYMNDMIQNQNNMYQDISDLHDAFEQLEEYVNNYFDNLDIQQEINNKIDELVASGELAKALEIVFPFATPEMYGAKGDGITDDYDAIMNAINASNIVLFYNKTYATSKSIVINKSISLIGNDSLISLINWDSEISNNAGVVILISGDNSTIDGVNCSYPPSENDYEIVFPRYGCIGIIGTNVVARNLHTELGYLINSESNSNKSNVTYENIDAINSIVSIATQEGQVNGIIRNVKCGYLRIGAGYNNTNLLVEDCEIGGVREASAPTTFINCEMGIETLVNYNSKDTVALEALNRDIVINCTFLKQVNAKEIIAINSIFNASDRAYSADLVNAISIGCEYNSPFNAIVGIDIDNKGSLSPTYYYTTRKVSVPFTYNDSSAGSANFENSIIYSNNFFYLNLLLNYVTTNIITCESIPNCNIYGIIYTNNKMIPVLLEFVDGILKTKQTIAEASDGLLWINTSIFNGIEIS